MDKKSTVKNRNEPFTQRSSTKIWHEIQNRHNPYISDACLCHGYDIIELSKKRGFADIIFLLIKGELPTPEQSCLFESLLVCLCNPGPRHAAVRAAMNAGVGKTNTAHILPISLSVLSGDYLGGSEVVNSMEFLRQNRKSDPENVAETLLKNLNRSTDGDYHISPGFGSSYGGIDIFQQTIAKRLLDLPGAGNYMEWGNKFAEKLKDERMSWLAPGICGAVFLDLGFHPRAGAGLYQLASAPGLLAHGLELANQPRTAYPFIRDDHYIIEPDV